MIINEFYIQLEATTAMGSYRIGPEVLKAAYQMVVGRVNEGALRSTLEEEDLTWKVIHANRYGRTGIRGIKLSAKIHTARREKSRKIIINKERKFDLNKLRAKRTELLEVYAVKNAVPLAERKREEEEYKQYQLIDDQCARIYPGLSVNRALLKPGYAKLTITVPNTDAVKWAHLIRAAGEQIAAKRENTIVSPGSDL